MTSGKYVVSKVSGVPHRGQKLRVPWSDDRKRAGSPVTSRKSAAGLVNQDRNAAPLVRRQIVQWQLVSWLAAPPAW